MASNFDLYRNQHFASLMKESWYPAFRYEVEGHCSQAGSRPFYKTTFEKIYRLPLPARAIKQNNTSSHLLIQDPAERAASKFCGNAVSDQGDGDAQPDVCRTGACEDLPDA